MVENYISGTRTNVATAIQFATLEGAMSVINFLWKKSFTRTDFPKQAIWNFIEVLEVDLVVENKPE